MTPSTEVANGWLSTYIDHYEAAPGFIAECMALGLIEEALEMMEAEGLTQAHMAQIMGVSPSYLSRILGAPPNLTLRSKAQLARALGTKPHVSLRPATEGDLEEIARKGLDAKVVARLSVPANRWKTILEVAVLNYARWAKANGAPPLELEGFTVAGQEAEADGNLSPGS